MVKLYQIGYDAISREERCVFMHVTGQCFSINLAFGSYASLP